MLILLIVAALATAFYTIRDVNKNRIEVGTSGGRALSLSMNPTMEPSSELIQIVGPNDMTDSSVTEGKNTPIEDRIVDIISTEGSFTNEDDFFIAGTFYIKNVTDETKTYTEQLKFLQSDKGTAKALRVMVIRNDDIVVYAHPKTDKDGNTVYDEDGNPVAEEVAPGQAYAQRYLTKDDEGNYKVAKNNEVRPWMCENFYCDEDGNYETYVINAPNQVIGSGEVIRYSLIIWFEGWDPECIDPILGGVVKLSLSFICDD